MNTLQKILWKLGEFQMPVTGIQPDYTQLLNEYGVLKSSSELSHVHKTTLAMHYSYSERAKISMAICSMLSDGDYLEFGSDGLCTFRNFLTAFDVSGLGKSSLTTRFYAFDIFGDTAGSVEGGNDSAYFKHWSNPAGVDKMAQTRSILADHNLFLDRCFLKQGYFQDTLTPEFKQSFITDRRRIGTLFLDCNIAESYRVVFDWSIDLIATIRCFVYMDEYYITSGVRELFEEFCEKAKDRYGMRPNFVMNAGTFGALFLLMK